MRACRRRGDVDVVGVGPRHHHNGGMGMGMGKGSRVAALMAQPPAAVQYCTLPGAWMQADSVASFAAWTCMVVVEVVVVAGAAGQSGARSAESMRSVQGRTWVYGSSTTMRNTNTIALTILHPQRQPPALRLTLGSTRAPSSLRRRTCISRLVALAIPFICSFAAPPSPPPSTAGPHMGFHLERPGTRLSSHMPSEPREASTENVCMVHPFED